MSLIISLVLMGTSLPIEQVVAVVSDRPVMHSQVLEYMAEYGMGIVTDPGSAAENAQYIQALEELVEKQLLVQAALDLGFYPSEDEILPYVEEELPGFSWGYLQGTQEEMRRYLTEAIGDEIAAQTFIGSRIQSALRNLPLSPETFLISSSELVDEAVMPRHVGWIYLPVLPGGENMLAAVAEISGLRERVLQGESFEELAMIHSTDGNSAINGGSLGSFGQGEMTASFERAVFALSEGELSQPVLSPFGVHLIRLDARGDDGTVEASHILISVPIEQDDINRRVDEASALRDSILADNGFDFSSAAVLHSQDVASAADGGDLGTIPLNLWLPAIAEAAGAMDPGGISQPVVLPEAGAVALVTVYDDPGEIDWSNYSEEELSGILQQVIYQDTYTEVLDSLRREIPVIYYVGTDR